MSIPPTVAETPGPRLVDALVDGALGGAAIWALEVAALGVGVMGIGGASVLATLRDDLCAWGLGYLAVGAALGLLRRPFGPLGPWGGWAALVLLADPGVAPRALYALVLVLAAAVGWAASRRPRRWIAVWALVGGLSLLAWPLPRDPPPGRPSDAPDLVLVVVDTLRADHVGAYGYPRPTTPNLDRLAAEGTRFTRARSTSSWTLPSHASLFTGLPPSAHGAHAGHPALDPGPETLAEALTARGYRTVGLSANAWVSGGTGLDRGFSAFGFLGDEGLASQLVLALLLKRPADLGGRALTDRAVAEIGDAAAAGEPLFLFVNYLEAHEPLGTLPEPALSRFSERPLDPLLGRAWLRDMPLGWCACEGQGTPTGDALACADGRYRAGPERIRGVIDRYDAGVAYVDARIGELRVALEAAGRLDRTLFVVTSDHGELLGEDGRLGHMVWLDDPLVEIPLIVRGPGVAVGLDDAPIDLAELRGWLLATLDGRPAPRRALATSEVHPHPASTARRWGALFGCDFTPILQPRLRVEGPDDVVRSEGPPGAADPTVALPPETRRALEALGYVE